MTERTFSIIKPDAVKRHLIGAILGRFESQGFRVVGLKMVQLTKEKENAVKDYRTLIGATNPAEAAEGTIRKDFALSQRENSVHGSDSVESAKREIAYFFVDSEIQP